jgi:hypothetical protein
MVPEVILSSERLAADVARVGPLVGVGAFVYQQIIALGELSTAELANKLFFRRAEPFCLVATVVEAVAVEAVVVEVAAFWYIEFMIRLG